MKMNEDLHVRIEHEAVGIMQRLNELSGTFVAGDASISAVERDAWSPTRRLAWQMRFEPEVVASGLITTGAAA